MDLSHIPAWAKWAFGMAGGVGLIWATVGKSARGAGKTITAFVLEKLPQPFRGVLLGREDEVKNDLRSFEQGAEDAIDEAAKNQPTSPQNQNPPPAA